MEKQENQINLSAPPCYNYQCSTSNALYYRSNVDNKEYIVLLQSLFCFTNDSICKYDIQRDEYISISSNKGLDSRTSFPFKSPKLSHIIHQSNDNNNQLLTLCTNTNELAVFNLHTAEYIHNYQQSICNDPISSSTLNIIMLWILLLSIFLCHNSILIASIYTILSYILSIKIANFTHESNQDIICVIPNFESLYNIESCVIQNESIHFVANNHQNNTILNHFKFDLKSRNFVELKVINVSETQEIYKIVYIECIDTLIMLTNTEYIWFYEFADKDDAKWRIFDDVKLPKIPGFEYDLNIVIGFKGIIFLFYYERCDEDCNEEDTFTYCWDLLFTGNMFECDNKYRGCGLAVNTDDNWTHFIGENPVPFHFKVALHNEIPVELSIIHLQYFHILIKQYILESIQHKIPNDVEMLILDYFPMFL